MSKQMNPLRFVDQVVVREGEVNNPTWFETCSVDPDFDDLENQMLDEFPEFGKILIEAS